LESPGNVGTHWQVGWWNFPHGCSDTGVADVSHWSSLRPVSRASKTCLICDTDHAPQGVLLGTIKLDEAFTVQEWQRS